MNNAKKWMVTLADEQYSWIRRIADETALSGSDIIRELIDRCMQENPKEFKDSLIEAQARIKLEALQAKRATLEEEIKALRNLANKSTKVTA